MTGEVPRRSARTIGTIVFVAVGYAVLGTATLMMARYAGLASPIWPAAGLAFAVVYQRGYPIALGVGLGSLIVNVNALLPNLGNDRILATAGLIALGATAQAIVAVALVRRFIGTRTLLSRPGAVIGFLLLAGLLASVINPTVGIVAQLWSSVTTPSEALVGWITWWVGDSIGVMVFGPIAMMLLPEGADAWRGRRWKVAIPSLVAVAALLGAFLQITSLDQRRIETAVDQLALSAVADLRANLVHQQEVLNGIRGLELASNDVTANEFTTFTQHSLDQFKSLHAVSWNPVVTQDTLAGFTAEQRSQPGMAEYQITERDADGNLVPAAPRPEYVVVGYIEPLATNLKALGFDIQSNPARAQAIATARDSGELASTPPIELVQESGSQQGMLTLLPVYAGAKTPETVTARRAAVLGYAVGVYRLDDLVNDTFSEKSWDGIDITLTDITGDPVEIGHHAWLDIHGDGDSLLGQASHYASQTMTINGRTWRLDIHPSDDVIEDFGPSNIPALLIGGMLIVGLLEAFLLLVTGMERQARREADSSNYEATHDALTDLLNRRAFLRSLSATCERSEFEGTDHVVMYLDLDGFKGVNDIGGHQAGDDMLRLVADVLRRHVRARDVVARVGGDEFAIILHNCPQDRGLAIAHEIVTGIQALAVPVHSGTASIGVSIGVLALPPGRKSDVDDVIRRADTACYTAKRDEVISVQPAS